MLRICRKPIKCREIMEKSLGRFEKYLWLWVFLCMMIGIFLAQFFPGLSSIIDKWKAGNVSIPIGVCLFLMMYPALLNFRIGEVRKLLKAPKPIVLTLLSNWLIAPFVTAVLAYYFLEGRDQLIVALILLGSSPCTAMVIVWGSLANGNQEQNVITTSINTFTITFLYAPVVILLTGAQGIDLDEFELFLSVLVFIGIPMLASLASRNLLVKRKGRAWFENIYRPLLGKIAIIALLFTLILLFTLNGEVLIQNPQEMLLVSIPLLIGFVIIATINILLTKLFRLKYKEAIITVVIGSSSHFEIAIATATALFGLGSQAALGTTMGLFWEVPVMLGLVHFGKYLKRKSFWNG